jgi:hypothetical protein
VTACIRAKSLADSSIDDAPAALVSSSSKSKTAILTGGDFPASAASAGRQAALSNKMLTDPIADKVRYLIFRISFLTFRIMYMEALPIAAHTRP